MKVSIEADDKVGYYAFAIGTEQVKHINYNVIASDVDTIIKNVTKMHMGLLRRKMVFVLKVLMMVKV